MASKLARSGDGRVEELSAPPTFPRSQTGFLIISYYGLPCRLQRALEEAQMARFVITPHFRLHEWVAEEKGYFKAEGLDYEFREAFKGKDLAQAHATANKIGAFQNIEAGRDSNVSCACHWTVNVAASKGHAKMYADAYSVSPSAVFVAPESPIKTPEDLRGVPISVGHQSGSHYSSIQALEQYMPLAEIKLSFADGILFSRMEKLFDRKVPAAAVFSGPYYFLEQMGFRKDRKSV